MIMPYKDHEKQKEAMRKINHNSRERQKNRLGFLELEVERLQKSLNHALANRVSYDKAPSSEVTVKTQDMTEKRKRHFEMSELWQSPFYA